MSATSDWIVFIPTHWIRRRPDSPPRRHHLPRSDRERAPVTARFRTTENSCMSSVNSTEPLRSFPGIPNRARSTRSRMPEGFKGSNTSAEIRIHPNGGFVYCSNRGDNNSIAVFRRDSRDGHLTPTQSVASGGGHPRNFTISPDGSWLICANRDSSNLVAFRIDPQTGQLTPSGNQVSIPKPTCVLFTPP